MKVSAVIVTRGDVDLTEILDSLPLEWEKVVWDNAAGRTVYRGGRSGRQLGGVRMPCEDLAVYGRYAAIEHASGDLIYVQDDDCVVEDPQALVNEWNRTAMFRRSPSWDLGPGNVDPHGFLVANMPAPFRHDFYADHCLVGFGAVFHRDLPGLAFESFMAEMRRRNANGHDPTHADIGQQFASALFQRTCDVVFTALTPRVLVDVPYRNLPWATSPTRMYRQGAHVGERKNMLDLALKVRDA